MQVSVVHPRMRVLHASPNAPALDVYIDDSPRFPNLTFGQLSDYVSLWPERHRLTVSPAGTRSGMRVVSSVSGRLSKIVRMALQLTNNSFKRTLKRASRSPAVSITTLTGKRR
mgnify:CR=1 FL=1